jgi:hypothetical protein
MKNTLQKRTKANALDIYFLYGKVSPNLKKNNLDKRFTCKAENRLFIFLVEIISLK